LDLNAPNFDGKKCISISISSCFYQW
jgi:hypothetical protein